MFAGAPLVGQGAEIYRNIGIVCFFGDKSKVGAWVWAFVEI